MTTLEIPCNKCRTPRQVQFEPNGLFSETFVRRTYVCDSCGPKPAVTNAPARPCEATRNPYRDD